MEVTSRLLEKTLFGCHLTVAPFILLADLLSRVHLVSVSRSFAWTSNVSTKIGQGSN